MNFMDMENWKNSDYGGYELQLEEGKYILRLFKVDIDEPFIGELLIRDDNHPSYFCIRILSIYKEFDPYIAKQFALSFYYGFLEGKTYE